MEERQPQPEGLLKRWKRQLGFMRFPIGVLFLVIAFILVITPFTPGSLVTLLIGLELLDLREWATEKWRRLRRRP